MNAKELLNKYIKYNSKITFDIFKLIYQKLIDLGFTSPHTVENAFKEFSGKYPYFTMRLYTDGPFFNQHSLNSTDQSEISVEDLLGYNPFESFKLPKQWCIGVQEMENTPKEIVNWRVNTVMCGTWVSPGYLNNTGYHTPEIDQEYTEITFEQFKLYVLKEPFIIETISESKVEEIVPEYVECFYSGTGAFIINKIYKCEELSSPNNLSLNSETGLKEALPYEGNLWKFKPSTKEAFEAQNKPKLIEKWSVGSYAVALKDKINWCNTQKGDIYEITNIGIATNLTKSYKGLSFSAPKLDTQFKWFATKLEAEEFTKTLINQPKFKIGDIIQANPGGYEYDENGLELPSAISYLKVGSVRNGKCTKIIYSQQHKCYWYKIDNYRNMFTEDCITLAKSVIKSKQVVHCKTQEEWDFVLSKLPSTCLLSKQNDRFKEYIEDNPIGIAVNTVNCGWSGLEWWKEEGYQILSFQEWCDLNGYKMKKTRFKKGDYVVSLRPNYLSSASIKYNYCYIQYKDGDKISIDSGTTMYEDNINYARLATPEEIEEYKRIGKPYDVTTLQTPKINTYGLNVGDKLDTIIIAAWETKGLNYFSDSSEGWLFGNGTAYEGNRKIENFKVIDGVVGFLVSGTLGIYLRAEGFKEFADNYYTENTSNFKVGSWYKYNGYYLKYSKTDNRNIFIASEYINTEDNSFKDDLIDFTCGIADGSKKLVTDLSLIQQYLPEGHPDLVNIVNKEVKIISKTSIIRITSREVKRINI